jgi:hypothetical protein
LRQAKFGGENVGFVRGSEGSNVMGGVSKTLKGQRLCEPNGGTPEQEGGESLRQTWRVENGSGFPGGYHNVSRPDHIAGHRTDAIEHAM